MVLISPDGCPVSFRLPPGEMARVLVGKSAFDTEFHEFDGPDPVGDASAEPKPASWVPTVIDGGL